MRRPLIVLLLLAAVLPTSVMASAWYRCAAGGELRPACCCPNGHRVAKATEAEPGPVIRIAACCRAEEVAARSADVRAGSDPSALASAIDVPRHAVPVLAPPSQPLVARLDEIVPWPGAGPPFLRHCALLL